MRIAQVTATFPPYRAGTGLVAYYTARELSKRGHEVVVFTGPGADAADRELEFQVRRLPAAVMVGNAPLTLGLYSGLRGFDLIHLHYPYIFGAEVTWAAARRFHAPLVVTYHNRLDGRTAGKGRLFKVYNMAVEHRLLNAADCRIAVNRDHAEVVLPTVRAWYEVPNGVDTTLFRPRHKAAARLALGHPGEHPLLLFVGALDSAHRFKNVDGLIRALPRLSADTVLWIVGDGNLRPELQRLVTATGVQSRVRFWGNKTHEDLPAFYNAADIAVLPSIHTESFGLVLVESMASGTPVVATALPGVRTVVQDGVDGLLVRPGSLEDLAQALKRLLSDPALRTNMGAAGHAKVARMYGWDRAADQLLSVYDLVLGRASSTSTVNQAVVSP